MTAPLSTHAPAQGGTAPWSAVPAALALSAVVLWCVVAALRVGYPYELEWMEGGMLQHVERVRAGEALYVAPTMEFAPFPYTPLYPWVAAGASVLFDAGFVALRAVSIAASLCAFGLLFVLARTAAAGRGGVIAGLLAAGLFAAGNRFTGAWLDIGRVDALATALGLGGLVAARLGRGGASVAAAAVLGAAACFTKQSQLPLALAAAVSLAPRGARSVGAYLGLVALLLAATAAWLDAASDGWFRFWTFDLLRDAPVHGPAVAGYWEESGVHLGPALLVVVYAGFVGRWRPDAGLVAAAVALVLTGWAGRAHEGGFENTLIPTLAAVALLFGPAGARAAAAGPRGALLAALAFVPLAHDPRPLVPTAADRRAGDELVERLRGLDPPLWIADHGYLARRAFGDEGSAGIHGMVINDLLKSGREAEIAAFQRALEDALGAGTFGAIVLDERWDGELPLLRSRYAPPVALFDPLDRRFEPVSGAPKRPTWLYLRRD